VVIPSGRVVSSKFLCGGVVLSKFSKSWVTDNLYNSTTATGEPPLIKLIRKRDIIMKEILLKPELMYILRGF